MPRAASSLAHGGSGDAGQPCLTAALVRSRCVYGRATLSKEGTLGGVPRFDMAHEAVLVRNRGSQVRGRASKRLSRPSAQQIEAAAKLATWIMRCGAACWARLALRDGNPRGHGSTRHARPSCVPGWPTTSGFLGHCWQ
jgi:hypothetical protein